MANARRRTQRSSRTNTRMAARATGASAAAALEANKAPAGTLVDWEKEMKYINKDLRELTIITIALFALLFIVGYFL